MRISPSEDTKDYITDDQKSYLVKPEKIIILKTMLSSNIQLILILMEA